MSTNTPHLSLLKPDPDALVNVVTQLNQNLDKLDASALNNSNRLGTLEALSGIAAGWKTFTPVFHGSDGTTLTPTNLILKGETFVLGDLCFFNISVKKNVTFGRLHSVDTTFPGPQLWLETPYRVKDPNFVEANGMMHPNEATYRAILIADPVSNTDSQLGFVSSKDVLGVNALDVSGSSNWYAAGEYYFRGVYRTTGEALLTLTDEV